MLWSGLDVRTQGEAQYQKCPGEKNFRVAETHDGKLLDRQFPVHPQDLTPGLDGIADGEKDPDQSLTTLARDCVARKRSRSDQHKKESDPVSDGSEPIGFLEQQRRQDLRQYEADHDPSPNLRV